MHLTRHPAIQRAAIGIAIWATAVVAWWVFDTPIQRHVERQVGSDVLVHVGLVVTALIFIALTFAAVTRVPVRMHNLLGDASAPGERGKGRHVST